ncbi:multiheme c-type cytochrome [Pseudodesulfovibrio sp.]|uniref:multiheme c-type cytochrome n=1 Tax=Pseudodesulfovibrio sp. TaxID=2035812 RepID=UPI0026291018|nr:multiheme c-type cytochrome [Pseudodesulfovibrio sp.]MDD3310760.1 multiheme c-type cytochrome [Pseudodesulfovibrio sp.]
MQPVRLIFLLCLCCLLQAAPARAQAIRDEGVIATDPPEAYAGSAACKACHQAQYDHWSGTLKARFVRYRKDVGALPGKWGKSPVAADKDKVFVVVGLHRKVAFVDADWRVLGAEYLLGKGKWKERPGWARSDYRSKCGMCHLTGCNPYEKRFTEPGVGCEACHGPGKRHAESEAPSDITTPGRDGSPALDTCRRCHNDRNNHAEAIRSFTGPYHPAR